MADTGHGASPAGPRTRVTIAVDGASRGNPGPAALGVVVAAAGGKVVQEIAEYLGEATNNVAEYRALLRGLEAARAHGAAEVEIRTDSELLARQLRGEYRVRSAALRPLHDRAVQMLGGFARWAVRRVPREANARADALANRALDTAERRVHLRRDDGNPGA